MEYSYIVENKKAQDFVKALSRNLKPEAAVLVDALAGNSQHATGAHYTFSCLLPPALTAEIQPITEALRKIDPTLQLIEPEYYHLTVFWCGMDKDVQSLIQIIKEAVVREPLHFSLHGLLAAPFGISLKAYPLNNTFFNLRQQLYAAAGIAMPMNEPPLTGYHERAVSTWITLARYTQPPKQDLLTYINDRLDLDMGEYVPTEIGAYISTNKLLKDPQTIEIIKNG